MKAWLSGNEKKIEGEETKAASLNKLCAVFYYNTEQKRNASCNEHDCLFGKNEHYPAHLYTEPIYPVKGRKLMKLEKIIWN